MERASVGAGDADLGQAGDHLAGAHLAAAACGARRPSMSCWLLWSKPRPTMWTAACEGDRNLGAGQVVHPWASAAWRARSWPAISSWSVRAQGCTPPALARAARASGASVPSETVEWQWRSAFRAVSSVAVTVRIMRTPLDDVLHLLLTLPFVEAQPVGQVTWSGGCSVRPNQIASHPGSPPAPPARRRSEMLLAHQALGDQLKRSQRAAPQSLGPTPVHLHARGGPAWRRQAAGAVVLQRAGQLLAVQPLLGHAAQRGVEAVDAGIAQRAPAAIAWPPNLASRSGSRLVMRSSASRRWKPGWSGPSP